MSNRSLLSIVVCPKGSAKERASILIKMHQKLRTLFDPWDAPWGMRGVGENTEVSVGVLSLILNTNGLLMHLFVVALF